MLRHDTTAPEHLIPQQYAEDIPRERCPSACSAASWRVWPPKGEVWDLQTRSRFACRSSQLTGFCEQPSQKVVESQFKGDVRAHLCACAWSCAAL